VSIERAGNAIAACELLGIGSLATLLGCRCWRRCEVQGTFCGGLGTEHVTSVQCGTSGVDGIIVWRSSQAGA
jgi:hypothetical protein